MLLLMRNGPPKKPRKSLSPCVYRLLNGMSIIEEELDPRLVEFLTEFRSRSDAAVSVEGTHAVIGAIPNCAILRGDSSSGNIVLAFHFDCHPLSVSAVYSIASEMIGDDLVLSKCFLSDVNGTLVYEHEQGFSLMHLQYLRDVVQYHEKESTAFVS